MAQYLAQQRVQMAMGEYIEELYNKADVKVTKTFESDALLEEAAAKAAQAEAKNAKAKTETKTLKPTNKNDLEILFN